MKRILIILLSLVSVVGLAGCKKTKETEPTESGKKPTETEVVTTPNNLVISKLITDQDLFENVIELYNNEEEELDLSLATLKFYSNGSTTVSEEIKLSGTVKPNEYFVIVSSLAFVEFDELNTFVHDDVLPYNGDDVIELEYDGVLIDQLGYKGFDIAYSLNSTLIRLGNPEDYTGYTEFDIFNFIPYLPHKHEYIGNENYEIKTLEDLYEGPRLEQRYLDQPFLVDGDMGTGGVALVNVSFIADGDTATFTNKDSHGNYPGNSLRYYYIDTPETGGPNTQDEPWGYVADKYNRDYLLKNHASKVIYIQSIPNYRNDGGYNRSIGLVWVNGHLSQFLIVGEGLSVDVSPYGLDEYDIGLSYKDVPYLTFIRFAQQRAIDLKYGTKGWGYNGQQEGQQSPDWDYDNDRNITKTPVWRPKFPVSWMD